MNDIVYFSDVKDGAFTSPVVRKLLNDIERNGGHAEVMVRQRREYMTTSQLNYYHSCIVKVFGEHWRKMGQMGDHGGPITNEQAHELLAARFLLVSEYDPSTRKYHRRRRSTVGLTKEEMSDYITAVKAYGEQEWGLRFPEPRQKITLI